MRIAITGASGYLGNVLTPLLLSNGHSLRLLTRKAPPVHPPDTVEYVYGDLLNNDSLQELVKDVDAVIHLAAVISVDDRPDEKLFFTNTNGTRMLAAAAQQAGVKRFIHLSSVTAYQQAPYEERMDESRPPTTDTRHNYDHSKAVSQAIALEHNGNGMEVLALAPTAVMGPYDQQPSLIGKAIVNIYNGNIPALFPGGVDFVDVRDVAGAIVSALTKGTPGQAYLLSGQWASLVTLAKATGNIKGKPISLPVVPLWLVFSMLPFVRMLAALRGGAPYYTRQSVYNLIYSNKKIDHSKAQAELGFQPRAFTDTLQDTIDWFKQTGAIK
ncbi:MAG: NAD-dependent epimerase/dehydratase family protein [Chitinophaga sp.]|uniref:NAD-dependent epimerase/dehydratase family protein n=1 Tax=Chitinophaga sp. TaxID=1869181 RepID=UPI001B1DED37|nr:NAD-dependent epimerase/dehydratase family protein [Chitinophaga sp.]MBO9731308.1 NAD-dependent epimerase/dehydratase family protein [Chitinophaga sp.]